MRLSGGKKQLLTIVTAVAILSTIGWYTLPPISQWNQRQLANQIAQRIEKGGHTKAGEPIASEPIRRLANLGTHAIDSLVTLTGSHRTNLAHRARQIIEEKFAVWQTQAKIDDDFDLATPLTSLASALVRQVDQLDPLGKRWAASLATRMVDLTESLPDSHDAKNLLGTCEQIFAAVPPHGPRLRSLPEAPQQQLSSTENKLNAPDIQLDLLAVPSKSARDIFSPQPSSRSPEVEISMDDTSDNSDALFPKPTTLDFKYPQQSSELSTQQDPYKPTMAPNSRLAPIPISSFEQTNGFANNVVDVPTPQEMALRQETLRKSSSRSLIAQLPRAGHYDAGSIRVVLRQRGFTEKEFPLATLLSSPHVEDRNQLVEAVAALPAGNARRWLRWLLEDESAEVRLRALTSLATTNDPELFRLAREMVVADKDVRVSELASRIMQQVR